jgi:hypothetical protein
MPILPAIGIPPWLAISICSNCPNQPDAELLLVGDVTGRHLRGLNRFAQEIVAGHFVQYWRHGNDDRDAEYG